MRTVRHPVPRRLAAALAALAALWIAHVGAAALAAVVLRASVEEMSDLAVAVVHGQVVARDVSMDREKGNIWTTATLRIEECLQGGLSGDVRIAAPGGQVGTIAQDVHGAARLEKGARYVVFLWKDPDGRLQSLGESWGAFRVRRDEATGEDVCSNSIDGLSLVDRAGKAAEAKAERLTMPEMRRRIAAARAAREERERKAREEIDRRLAEMRRRAEEQDRRTRGRPGGAE